MCGIVGYVGKNQAPSILIDGLGKLEYRGYDSAGIAYFNQDSQVRSIKKVGKVAALRECVKSTCEISHCGIGHTRWATHGGVTDANAHPHSFGQVTLIHNGIIENYRQLTQEYGLEDRQRGSCGCSGFCLQGMRPGSAEGYRSLYRYA